MFNKRYALSKETAFVGLSEIVINHQCEAHSGFLHFVLTSFGPPIFIRSNIVFLRLARHKSASFKLASLKPEFLMSGFRESYLIKKCLTEFCFLKCTISKIGRGNCPIAQIKTKKVQSKKVHIGSMHLCFIVKHSFSLRHRYVSYDFT